MQIQFQPRPDLFLDEFSQKVFRVTYLSECITTFERRHTWKVMVVKMYEAKKKYEGRDEVRYHIPEWLRILREYFRKDYSENHSGKPVQQKNKKKNVEDLLR